MEKGDRGVNDDDEQNNVQILLDPEIFGDESSMAGETSEVNENSIECIELDDSEEEAEVDAASWEHSIQISAFETEPSEMSQPRPVTQPNMFFSVNGIDFTSDFDR